MDFLLPPQIYNSQGEIRKAGFEIEYGSLDLDQAAQCIIELFGGQENRLNTFIRQITGTSIGDFMLKMDSRFLTEKKYQGYMDTFGLDNSNGQLEGLVESVASWVVPYEISTPVLPFNEVYKLDALRKKLHEKKASGTGASIFYAFATHINAEPTELDVKSILGYLRAFLLLYPWLFEESKVSFTRWLSPYIEPFPDEYTRMVLHFDYAPSLEAFIKDYNRWNPDRNRPLDLYPIFSYLAPGSLKNLRDIGIVRPRPALHYRLPNCQVDEKDWSLACEWNRWIEVEKLSHKKDDIQVLAKEYLETEQNTWLGFLTKWRKRSEQWLKNGK